jgi:hypothetical protein
VALLFLGSFCGFLVGYIAIETFFEFDSEYSASCFVKLTMENIKALFRQVHAGNSTCPGTGKRSIYDWSNHQPDARQGRDAIASAKRRDELKSQVENGHRQRAYSTRNPGTKRISNLSVSWINFLFLVHRIQLVSLPLLLRR